MQSTTVSRPLTRKTSSRLFVIGQCHQLTFANLNSNLNLTGNDLGLLTWLMPRNADCRECWTQSKSAARRGTTYVCSATSSTIPSSASNYQVSISHNDIHHGVDNKPTGCEYLQAARRSCWSSAFRPLIWPWKMWSAFWPWNNAISNAILSFPSSSIAKEWLKL